MWIKEATVKKKKATFEQEFEDQLANVRCLIWRNLATNEQLATE